MSSFSIKVERINWALFCLSHSKLAAYKLFQFKSLGNSLTTGSWQLGEAANVKNPFLLTPERL
jgi:hypothetical protein